MLPSTNPTTDAENESDESTPEERPPDHTDETEEQGYINTYDAANTEIPNSNSAL